MRCLLLSVILAGACIVPALAAELPALPADMPRAQQRAALLAAGRAAVAFGQGALARQHAARLLWQLEPPAEDARAARLIVIDSYVVDRQGEEAFRAMLRYQQDYAPLDRATAARFVEQLLALDLEKYALNWLASLDDASPVKLILRFRTGLVAVESVVAQARAELAKGGGVGYWRVLAEAAQRQKDPLLRIEAEEQLLNSSEDGAVSRPAAAALWSAYSTGAQALANRSHMLSGDDAAWADLAGRQLGGHPHVARALYAHLAQHGRERATREIAQLQLAYSLQQARLERTAILLFDTSEAGDSTLDAQARYLLGAMAERAKLPALAARFWKGLAPPPGVGVEEWKARLTAVCARSAGGC